MLKYKLLLIISVLLISSCGLKQIDKTGNWSANKLYTAARNNTKSGNYKTAINYYQNVKARYPYSKEARQADIDLIYAYFKSEEPNSAIEITERFISENPNHPHLDYVYYMRGIVYAESSQDMISRMFPQNPAQRDPEALRDSFKYFAELVSKFPHSKYSQDATQRMIYTRNKIAEHELHIARFYMKRKSWVASINRAQTVVENYQKTTAVPEALHILRDSYNALGLHQKAAAYQRIIQYNGLENYQAVTFKKRSRVVLPPPRRIFGRLLGR